MREVLGIRVGDHHVLIIKFKLTHMKLLETWGYYNTMQVYKLFNKYANIQVVQNNKNDPIRSYIF
jgi:hypothetical protein